MRPDSYRLSKGCTARTSSRPGTKHFIEEAAKLRPLALICEGTHPEVDWYMSEEDGSGLIDMVEEISPRYLIPIHTENPRKIQQVVVRRMRKAVRVVLPVQGQALELL